MSFLEKLGIGKKHDDDDMGLPPMPDEPYDPSKNQQWGDQSDPTSPPWEQQASESPQPQYGNESIPATPGQQMAHDYMQRQQQQPQPAAQQTDNQMELVQIKLDAIRSELSAISQRLTRLEDKFDRR